MDDIDLDEEIFLPLLSIYEEPEQLLEVKDEEVCIKTRSTYKTIKICNYYIISSIFYSLDFSISK